MNLSKLFSAIVMGFYLVSCGGGQQTEQTEKESSNPEKSPTEEVANPKVTAETTQTDNEIGAKVYNQYCYVCHQADGKGVPGAFPPLTNTEWVNGNVDTLISIVVKGRQGEMEVNGEKYNSVMTPHGFLTDEEIAGVITYVRQNFGNNSSEVTVEEVAAMRAKLQ